MNIHVIDSLISCLTLQEGQGQYYDAAIIALTALINHTTQNSEENKLILTQLFVQKLLSPKFKKQLVTLMSSVQVKNYRTLSLLCKVCERSKEMCVVIVDQEEYMCSLEKNFRELVTQSGSEEMEGLEEWILHVIALWCILRYHQQDISQQ